MLSSGMELFSKQISCSGLADLMEEQGGSHLSNICNILLPSGKSGSLDFQKYKLVRRCDSEEGVVGHALGWCPQEFSE